MPKINNINKIEKFLKKDVIMKETFEPNPLDISLEKMVMSLRKRCEREISEYGDFAPVVERYINKDSSIYAGNIYLKCYQPPKIIENYQKKRYLELVIETPSGVSNSSVALKGGSKKDILETLKNEDFAFEVINKAKEVISDLKDMA